MTLRGGGHPARNKQKKRIRRRNGGKKASTAKKCDALTARRMPHCNVPLEMINNNKKKTWRDVGAEERNEMPVANVLYNVSPNSAGAHNPLLLF